MTDAPPTLTITETHSLLAALMGEGGTHKQYCRGVRNYTIAMLMLEAGLRVGELTRLHWDTLFFNCLPVTSIIIPAEISKSNQDRQIPVSTRLSNALTTYHSIFATPSKDSGPAYAFTTTKHNHHLTTRQVERIIGAASMQAFGRPIHPHVLRHTFATKIMRVAPASVVQQLLGHKHLTSTQVYCHPNNQDLKDAIDKLPAIQEAGAYDSFLSADPARGPQDLHAPDTNRDVG